MADLGLLLYGSGSLVTGSAAWAAVLANRRSTRRWRHEVEANGSESVISLTTHIATLETINLALKKEIGALRSQVSRLETEMIAVKRGWAALVEEGPRPGPRR